MKDLTNGNPIKLLLSFAIPVAIGNVLQLLYNITDTKIIGKYLGEAALAAVGATASLNSLVIGFLIGLSNGFGIITARYFGAKDEKNLKKSFAVSLIIGICAGIILTTLCIIFLPYILNILNTPKSIFNEAHAYISIILAGIIFVILYNICTATLRAIGDSISPLIFLSFSIVLNIFLDILFIKYLKFGVRGGAYATVFSQFICVTMCIIYILKRYNILRLSITDFKFNVSFFKTSLFSGLSMGIMMSLVNFGTLSLQSAINTLGSETIVAHTAARKLTEMFMLPFSVFGTTMTTYCSQNLGAKKLSRIKQGLLSVILIAWCWSILVIIASYTIVPSLISFITSSDSETIITTATKYLKFNTLFYFVPAVIAIVRCSMQGIGDNITPIISSFIELTGKILIVLYLAPKLHYTAIIISEPIVWILMVIPLIIMIIKNPVMHAKS